jgi:hypothetical protein
MITIVMTVEDEASAGLKAFEEHFPGTLDASLRGTALAFRNHVRKNYLSGQMLNRITGDLWKSIHHGKSRRATHDFIISSHPQLANIYSHPGGANIAPSNAKALRWWKIGEGYHFSKHSHLAEKPFMRTAVQAFDFGAQFKKSADRAIEKAIKKARLNG